MKKTNKTVKLILAVIAWGVFLWLPFILFFFNRDAEVTKNDWYYFLPHEIAAGLKSERFVYSYIFSILLLVNFYFINKSYFIPYILARKKTILYITVITACFFLYLTVLYYITLNSREHREFINSAEFKKFVADMLAKNPSYNPPGPRYFSTGPMALFLLLFVIGLGSNVVNQWFSAEEKKEEITRQQLQTELSFLKSQVNPHFLFNSLNSIYSLSLAHSKQTSNAVMKLSRIMRYTLEEAKNNTVSLTQEIEFINNYIEMQKLRLTENVCIQFATSGNTENVYIAPMLLIPFIENAFKYGISTHNKSIIRSSVMVEGKQILFSCSNTIFPNLQKNKGTGTGISNTRRRIELLYPGKHELIITEGDDKFDVKLTIQSTTPDMAENELANLLK
ncbi:MAG TPA: sensor histidine kinase [Chitinophagaceae bacterium]|nr:sensor histidine kinase [Chitinophagaceae bacterium]